MRDDNCIFCKLANGVFPTNSIYEDDDFYDFDGDIVCYGCIDSYIADHRRCEYGR